jgi:hypothetical protein
MDRQAPKDDLHDHPDFDVHVHRQDGRLRATVWLFGTRHELVEEEQP